MTQDDVWILLALSHSLQRDEIGPQSTEGPDRAAQGLNQVGHRCFATGSPVLLVSRIA